jgi:transcriptional regulator of arginine metabolism
MNIYAPRRSVTEDDAVSRRQAITEIVSSQRVGSQAELVRLLRKRGLRVTQSTLSRDLKALGVGRVPDETGVRYVLPGPSREILDTRRQQLEIEAFVQGVDTIQNLVLVRTPPGNAHGVARAVDLLGWPEVAGTLAGDDTILVVTRSAAQARRFRERLSGLAGRSFA